MPYRQQSPYGTISICVLFGGALLSVFIRSWWPIVGAILFTMLLVVTEEWE